MNFKCGTILNLKCGTILNLDFGAPFNLNCGTPLNLDCRIILNYICIFLCKVTFLSLRNKKVSHSKTYPHKTVNIFNATGLFMHLLKTLIFHVLKGCIKKTVTLNMLIEKVLHVYYFFDSKNSYNYLQKILR